MKSLRIAVTVAAGASLTIGTLAVIPVATAAEPTTTRSSFTTFCRAVPSAYSGAQEQSGVADVAITAPESVQPNQPFTATVDPGTVAIPNSTSGASLQRAARFKIDMEVPSGAEFLGATIVDPGTFTSGVAPSVIRVDEAGNPSATGTILRLSGGNQTIGNGPSSSTSRSGGMTTLPQGGSETVVRFPTFALNLRAGESGSVEARLRTAGAASQFGSAESFLTFLPMVRHGLAGNINAPTYCQPRDSASGPLNSGGGVLRAVPITGEPWAGETYEVTTALEATAETGTGDVAHLVARVAPTDIPGTVQFLVDGVPVGSPRGVVDGVARLDVTFGSPGEKTVTAQFTADPDFVGVVLAPPGGPATVTVTGEPTGPDTPTDPPADTGSLGSLTGSLGGDAAAPAMAPARAGDTDLVHVP
ncbi:Ig-like domain-containing protein [Dietzia sp. 179-F 9C3 NHS]|uniref:Ig-like domain-containing protein n=1 Tax=Dietzia sp. 179-F 9C3 NHS TaxID=3374295 RepID=UPI00387A65D1